MTGIGPRERRIPEGDDRERLVCPECSFVAYDNPKVVCGVVVGHEGGVILCRRAIEPRRGFWTLPAGYLELGETPEAGARREAWEEARVELELTGLLAVYAVPRISQVQLLYRARLARPGFAPGPESLEVELFGLDDMPWDELAFPTVRWALERYREVGEQQPLVPASNPPGATGRMTELEGR